MKTILLWIGGIVMGLIVVQIVIALASLLASAIWAGVSSMLSIVQRNRATGVPAAA